jgi:hypothetical protein
VGRGTRAPARLGALGSGSVQARPVSWSTTASTSQLSAPVVGQLREHHAHRAGVGERREREPGADRSRRRTGRRAPRCWPRSRRARSTRRPGGPGVRCPTWPAPRLTVRPARSQAIMPPSSTLTLPMPAAARRCSAWEARMPERHTSTTVRRRGAGCRRRARRGCRAARCRRPGCARPRTRRGIARRACGRRRRSSSHCSRVEGRRGCGVGHGAPSVVGCLGGDRGWQGNLGRVGSAAGRRRGTCRTTMGLADLSGLGRAACQAP